MKGTRTLWGSHRHIKNSKQRSCVGGLILIKGPKSAHGYGQIRKRLPLRYETGFRGAFRSDRHRPRAILLVPAWSDDELFGL